MCAGRGQSSRWAYRNAPRQGRHLSRAVFDMGRGCTGDADLELAKSVTLRIERLVCSDQVLERSCDLDCSTLAAAQLDCPMQANKQAKR